MKQIIRKILKSIDERALKNIIAIVSIFVLIAVAGSIWIKYIPDFGIKEQAASYNEIAQNLSDNKGFTWRDNSPANEAPGYPYFLAVIYFTTGYNHTAVKIIQILLLGLIGVFAYFTCKRLSIKFALALPAALVVAVWPYFLLYSNLILPEIILALTLIISIFLLLLFQKTPTYLKAISLGIILGLAVLIRPMALILPLWMSFGIFAFIPKFRKSENFLKLVVLITVFVVTLSPWAIRNYREFNQFTPIRAEISATVQPENIKQGFSIKNAYLFWNPGATGKQAQIVATQYPKANILILLYKIIFFLVLSLALLSLKFLKQKKILLLWFCVVYFWAGYVFISPLPRYTLPVIPIVIILAAFSISRINEFLPKKSK